MITMQKNSGFPNNSNAMSVRNDRGCDTSSGGQCHPTRSLGNHKKMSFVSKSVSSIGKVLRTSAYVPTGPEIVRVKYYLPSEVAVHNSAIDCWVSYNGGVYDLTDLCKKWAGTREIQVLLAHAGKDISHWFDHETNDIKYHVHPVTGVLVPYCPHGPIPDVIPHVVPASSWRPLDKCPWWLDERYKKGCLTKNPRPCRILNTLTGTEIVMMVCEEDTVKRIQKRALIYNANGRYYTWKFEGKELDLNSTLTENGIPDERDRFVVCGLPDDYYVPCLMCYYNDKCVCNEDYVKKENVNERYVNPQYPDERYEDKEYGRDE
ncbi:cytochrome b5 domain-containing protein 1 [Augochlora pura]